MESTNNFDVSQIRDYLPNPYATSSKPEVPVMSNQTAAIFAKNFPTIPNSKEEFLKVKPLDKSAVDITAKVAKVKEVQKNDNKNITLAVLALVGSVILVVAVITTVAVVAILFPYSLIGLIIPQAVGIGGGGVSLNFLIFSIFLMLDTFAKLPTAQKELKASVDLANVNHEKLKNYFNENYTMIHKNIKETIFHKNQDFEKLTDFHDVFSDHREKLLKDTEELEQALVQLENLHQFYQVPANA